MNRGHKILRGGGGLYNSKGGILTLFISTISNSITCKLLPVAGISLFLCVHCECVEPHRGVVIGQHAEIEVIELKRKGKLTENL